MPRYVVACVCVCVCEERMYIEKEGKEQNRELLLHVCIPWP